MEGSTDRIRKIEKYIVIRRHNGQNPYGPWLSQNEGDIPKHVYESAAALAIGAIAAWNGKGDKGHIVIDGTHYDWIYAMQYPCEYCKRRVPWPQLDSLEGLWICESCKKLVKELQS